VQTSSTELDVYADDMRVGDAWNLGSYQVTEEEIIAFATHWDPQFFHVDPERAATEGYLGGVIASGVQTLAIYQRLSVTSRIGRWHVIAGAGIQQLRFRRPARPGDTLTGRTVVEEVRFEPDRNRAFVTYAGELVNQDDERALTLTMSAYLKSRPS